MNKWEEEEDQVDFESNGLTCAMIRGPVGAWCGYVGIPDTHKWHGQDYDDTVKVSKEIMEREIDIDKIGVVNLLCSGVSKAEQEANLLSIVLSIDVHGGLTYSSDHAPKKEKDGLWWFGFDCAHAGDLSPGLNTSFGGDTYRDQEYVKAECESLAKQLASFA